MISKFNSKLEYQIKISKLSITCIAGFFSNYSVLAQLGFSLAWLGWAVTKIQTHCFFLLWESSGFFFLAVFECKTFYLGNPDYSVAFSV